MNVWSFTGNLGKDAELRTTQGGTSILAFNVAVKSGYGDREKTTWAQCRLFGKRAEGNLSSYLVKGQQVAVSGEMALEEWTAQDGTQRSAVSVNVNDITLVGSKTAPVGQQQPRQQHPQGGFAGQPGGQQQAPQQPQPGGFDDFDDDIPF